MYLSKSLYTRGLQCPKSLWLKKHHRDVLTPPDTAAQAVFETGNMVGDLACNLFPGGKEIPYEDTSFARKTELTQEWIVQGIKNIYEATFSFDDVLVMVDILHIRDDGKLELYEVKSSTEVKDIHVHDASIQYYVVNGLGYNIQSVNIVHINNDYVRSGQLELDQLFHIVNVSDGVIALQNEIPDHLERFKQDLCRDVEPAIDIGPHCRKPYECDALNYCWHVQKEIPEYSVFDISSLKADKKFNLYQQGIIKIEDINDLSAFSAAQKIQIESEKSGQTIINQQAIEEFVKSLVYPIYHLDFETFQQAVPEWDGISPYMQIPFQYSIHIEHEDGALEHKEFLAGENEDPRQGVAKQLVEDIPQNVTVLAYNMGFEKGVIRKLAHLLPDYDAALMSIHDNIMDLMRPFQKRDFYTPAMRGSYSIKYVLPALVPEMQQAYKELDLVHDGSEAMRAFAELNAIDDVNRKQEIRKSLLSYCHLDTLAMVKILDVLRAQAGDLKRPGSQV